MGIKKGSGQPMVSALTYLQCFDTAGWVTGRIFVHEEPVSSYPQRFSSRTSEETEVQPPADPGSPGKRPLEQKLCSEHM